jgi:hypothetical protein
MPSKALTWTSPLSTSQRLVVLGHPISAAVLLEQKAGPSQGSATPRQHMHPPPAGHAGQGRPQPQPPRGRLLLLLSELLALLLPLAPAAVRAQQRLSLRAALLHARPDVAECAVCSALQRLGLGAWQRACRAGGGAA